MAPQGQKTDHGGDGTVAQLLADLEREARSRAYHLEKVGRLRLGFTHTHYPLTPEEQAASRRGYACWLLATDLDTLRALLAGERVPAGKLKRGYLDLHRERTQ